MPHFSTTKAYQLYYRDRPVTWMVHEFGVPPEHIAWSLYHGPYESRVWQGDEDPLYEAAKSIADDNRSTLLYGACGTGKTVLAALLGLWWISTRPMSKVVAFAPSLGQLQDGWLNEVLRRTDKLRKVHPRASATRDGLFVDREQYGDSWMLHARSAHVPAGRDETRLADFPAENTLVIVEDANRVKPSVLRAIKHSALVKGGRVLMLCNPEEADDTNPPLPYANRTIRVSALDHPNHALGREVILGATTRELEQALRLDAFADLRTNDPERLVEHGNYARAILGAWPIRKPTSEAVDGDA